MQQTGFLPIPSGSNTGPATHAAAASAAASGSSFPRQASFGDIGQPGPSRWNESPAVSGLSTMMRNNGTPPGHQASPSSNPHSGFHPSSFGPLSFSALALGASQNGMGSSPYSSSMAMSISPPRWQPGSMGNGFGGGSFVGSVGALGTSYGRQAEGRERELEAKYVRDFTCCGRQLLGLHELLEHYEEEHANLAPDVRMAAINAVQSSKPPFQRSLSSQIGMSHGDAPQPPGMMDIEMDDPTPATPQAMLQQASVSGLTVGMAPGVPSPWSAAFRPPSLNPPACVPPSVLSYAPPAPSTPSTPVQQQARAPQLQTTQQQQTPQQSSAQSSPLTAEQMQARVMKKAQKKAEREAKEAAEEADHDLQPGEKRFRCPIEGCGKVYKQANGLKYHLTRSINSGHGNVAAMGGLMALLAEAKDDE
ncbi:Zinc finger protein sfp1 [Vanrija pseudolonga]|uniref:Zinc finger protein sfp1 n=1 Tax=Vanrija pseudolonga TaxID=143232 RepID=A0AAF0YGA0_9TREE|nr:Zinc finger protein sfp1 [Vanrija pseudolonga]